MDVFEFTDDSEEELGFLSVSNSIKKKAASRQDQLQLQALHDSTKSLLDSIKKVTKTTKSTKQKAAKHEEIKEELKERQDAGDSSSVTAASTPALDASRSNNTSATATPTGTTPKAKNTPKTLASSLPLMLPSSQPRATTLLVQLEDAKLDLSGDVGAIGRFHLHHQDQILLDLKGHQYVGEIVPCGSFMVVGLGANEAKVESIVSDFCQISKQTNVLEQIGGIVTAGNLQRDEDLDQEFTSQKQKSDAFSGNNATSATSNKKTTAKKQPTPRKKKAPASTTKTPRKKLKNS